MGFVCTRCKREVETPGHFCPFCGTPAPPPESDASDPLIGRTVANKYFVSQRIGRGGMGQVYRATDVVLDRQVALKVLNRSLLSDPSMVQRFHREGRAASRLNHPNCITILDVGQAEDETLFIAMEYLAGRPLSRVLAEESPLDQGRVVRIVAQILSALADAHAVGIVHRDLKPSNVVVEARRDEPDFVKVLDFGIAKLSEPGNAGAQLTGTGVVCGTPGYMSPEQARGEELDARSDLYAVGVILYELLSGRLPFESETPFGFVAKHLTEAPTPLRQRRPDLHIAPDLEALVERAMAKDRTDRPASAEAMRQELLACRLPSAGPERVTPRPERAATVVIPAARPGTQPPRPGAAADSAPAWQPVRFDRPTGTTARRPDPAPEGAARTPAPRPGNAAREPAPGPDGAARERTPRPSRATPPPVDGPDQEQESGPTPVPSSARPGRTGRPAPARGRAGRRGLWAAIGGAAAILAVVVYLLVRSDPFAEPAPAPDAEVRLTLGGAPGARPSGPPRPLAPRSDPSPGSADPVAPSRPEPPAPVSVTPPEAPRREAAPPVRDPPAAPPRVATQPGTPGARSAPARPRKGAGILEQTEAVNVLAVPAPASGQGVLSVTASPWGVVTVDGRELGETPRELRVGEGTYRVKVAHPMLGVREREVVAVAGRRVVFNVSFSGQ